MEFYPDIDLKTFKKYIKVNWTKIDDFQKKVEKI